MDRYICKNKIIKNENRKNRNYEQVWVRFSSILSSNLSGSVLLSGGNFTGNGWIGCSFYGSRLKDVTAELEQYDRCCMSFLEMERARLGEIGASECVFLGGRWRDVHMRDCSFRNCNFRKFYMGNAVIEETMFRECVFDGAVFEQVRLSGVLFQKCVFLGEIKEFPVGGIFQNCLIDC